MRLDMSGARKTVHGCGVDVVDNAVAGGEGDSGGGTLAAGIGPGSWGSGLAGNAGAAAGSSCAIDGLAQSSERVGGEGFRHILEPTSLHIPLY